MIVWQTSESYDHDQKSGFSDSSSLILRFGTWADKAQFLDPNVKIRVLKIVDNLKNLE